MKGKSQEGTTFTPTNTFIFRVGEREGTLNGKVRRALWACQVSPDRDPRSDRGEGPPDDLTCGASGPEYCRLVVIRAKVSRGVFQQIHETAGRRGYTTRQIAIREAINRTKATG